jgi:hypothetical protein
LCDLRIPFLVEHIACETLLSFYSFIVFNIGLETSKVAFAAGIKFKERLDHIADNLDPIFIL